MSKHPSPMPALDDNNSSAPVRFEHIPVNNFGEEGFPDLNFPLACERKFQLDQHHAVQQECLYHNDDEDTEHLPDMWRNWINLTSEPQSLDSVFGVSSMETFPPNGRTSGPTAINASSIQRSPLSSTTLPTVANDHKLKEENHVKTHLDTVEPSSSYLETNPMAPLSPPPVDKKATPRRPPSHLKAKAGPHKMKPAGATKNFRNNGTRKDEEVQTCLVEGTEDGYTWHKYGQKRIKNRMHPRCYFKCAHPKCPIKKRTESSSEMQGLVLITYIGKHSHSHPHPNQMESCES